MYRYRFDMNPNTIIGTHGILYKSSASQNGQLTSFRKIFGIFSLFIAKIDNIDSSKQRKMALQLSIIGNDATFVENSQRIRFHSLV